MKNKNGKAYIQRGISLFLSLCLLFSLLPMQALAAGTEEGGALNHPFTDVPKGSWYEKAVQYAWEQSFFNGTTATTFGPDGSMTRGMFVTVLARMAGVDTAAYSGNSPFADVSAEAWYAPAVTWAAKYGITSGTGGGFFSPNALIDRQQMATFFMRYFEIFGVEYNTVEEITNQPADLSLVADWAMDAVSEFWKTGLLVGDGTHFDPTGNATRAQMAMLCMRVDKAVETWYKEPGVPADDGEPELPNDSIIPNLPSGNVTRYYEVKFELGEGQNAQDVIMPETKTYASGTKVEQLPTPYARGQVFLGWYYDAALTDRAASSDTICSDLTLYAQMAAIEDVPFLETPSYCTKTDVGTNFTFQVKAASEQAVRDALTVIQISANNTEVTELTITGSAGLYTVSGSWTEGHTYKAQLDENSDAVFVVDGQEQPDSTDSLNFLTAKAEVLNLSLDDDIVFIPKNQVSGMSESLSGLFTVSMGTSADGGVQSVSGSVSFTYTGSETIDVGDTVAIYSGTKPDNRTMTTDNDTVAYVNITGKDGTTYSYTTADAADVMFTPDVFPVSENADTDGNTDDNSITVSKSTLDFSGDQYEQMGLNSQTTVDVGDYIAFYTGEFGDDAATVRSYAKITEVTESDDVCIVTYEIVTLDEIMTSMDIYNARTEEIEMTDAEIVAMEADIEQQAIDSGFVEQAVSYLAAMALETDGFQTINEDMNLMSLTVNSDETVPFAASRAKGSVEITEKKVDAKIKVGPNALEHFEDGVGGMRAELTLTFEMEIKADEDSDNKIVISVEAVFEQEVLLGINVSGGAIWKMAWIIPYIYDYQLNANFDVGTYTGIAVTATMATAGEDEGEEEDEEDDGEGGIFDFEWGSVLGGDDDEDKDEDDPFVNIGKQIEELMDQGESFFGEDADGEDEESEEEGDDPIHMSLLEQYAEMMESAEDSWIELVRKELFNLEGSVDPFHILCYGVSADFVVSANMYITLGMTFEYGNAKRYNFSLLLFHQQTTSETIDLETAHYEFIFYVMGTLGIRAGIEFEVAVGLISLKLDSIGITAEAGAYAQLCGYFYYKLTWTEGSDREQFCAGALFFEIGIYLEIKFKAQLFSSEKLTYNPTLYENEWPILTVGEQANVYDFNYEEDDEELLSYEFQTVKTLALPTDLFEMRYLDLRSGELYGADADDEDENPAATFDDATESRFTILFSNPAFSYNPNGNVITVTPSSESSVAEETEMTIIWKGGTLAFTSMPISRTITIAWSDPANARYISFNSMGGSSVKMISTSRGASIVQPKEPTKQGYTFGGWYEDKACTSAFAFPDAMPDYAEPERGITVYAKWIPAPNTYKVEYYTQELSGKYTLMASQTNDGYTDSPVAPSTDAPEGFALNAKRSTTDQTIAANGSTVVKLYYDRLKYTLTFTYGDKSDGSLPNVVYRDTKYGATIYEPKMNLGGYLFNGWEGGAIFTDTDGNPIQTMPAGDATYAASWRADPNISYRVEYYIQDPAEDKWYYGSARTGTGETESLVPLSDYTTPGDGLDFNGKVTVKGTDVQPGDELLKIKGDGSLVVKIYFDRTTHTVTFNTDGGSSVDDQTVRDTGKVTLPAVPTKVGYTFTKWTYQDANGQTVDWDFSNDTVIGDLTLTAQWIPNGDTAYTVEHYWQNTIGDTDSDYTLHETEDKTGTTGENTAAEGKTYEGFQGAKAFEQTAIAADGSTVVKIYYDRVTYAVTFTHDGNSEEIQGQTIRYDGKVTEPEIPTKAGYDFDCWKTADGGVWNFDTNTVTDELALAAQWKAASNTSYTVKHYQENLDGTYPTDPADSEEMTGTTGENASVKLKEYTGFGTGTYTNVTIAADGSTVVEVRYPRNNYTVTWYDWDGTTELGNGSFKYEQTITVSNAVTTPSRTGYTFTSWKDAGTMPAEDKTIVASAETANWTANTYTVIFNANGGTGSMENQAYTYDVEQALTANSFSKSGYTFAGWNTQPDGSSTPYTDAQQVSNLTAENNEAVTLYAQWTKGAYTISYDLAGGTLAAANPASYDVETESFTLNNPTRTGYTFDGWTGTGLDSATVNVTVTKGSTGNRSYTATWTANTNTVTFDYNYEGAPTADEISQTYDSSYVLPESPERAGYAFVGWYTAADGGTLVEATTRMTATEDHSLYAHWELGTATPYIVKHWQQNISDDQYTEVTGDQQRLTGTTNGTTNAQAKSYTGFTAKTIEQLTIAADGTTVVNVYYDRNTYTAKWDVDGTISTVDYRYGAAITKPNDPVKEHYTFSSWSGYTDSMTMGDADITFTAQWTAVTYSVTLNTKGGTAAELTQYTYGTGATLPTATRTGYAFDGWYDNEDCTGSPVTEISTTDSGNKVFYAKWTAHTYTVVFHANGGEGSMNSQAFTYDVEQSLTANTFTKSGYTFTGWNTQANGDGAAYASGAEVSNLTSTNNDTVNLYAQWSEQGYSITYNLDGGTASGNPTGYSVGSADIALIAPTKTGYTFAGWSGTDLTGENNMTVTIPTGSTGDREYTAHWTANSYTVSFDANGGEGSMDGQSFTYDVAQNLTANAFTRSGYTFSGWSTQANGNGTPYTNAQQVSNLTAENNGTVTLYAQWSEAGYSISYALNGGAASNPASYSVNSADFTLNNPTKTGYTFTGWSGTGLDGESNMAVTITQGSTGNRSYTAHWSANSYTVIFNANGGDGNMTSQSFTYDVEKALEVNAFTRTGYEFSGWNTAADSTGTAYVGEANVSNLASENGTEVTLYAQWTVKTYTISYYDDNTELTDTGYQDKYTYSATAAVTFQITTPEKENHTFTGWTCSNDGVTITADNGEYTVTIPAGTAENITITANWKQNGIKLYDPIGNPLGELSEGTALSYTVDYTDNGTTVSNAVVAYWKIPNTDIHYYNGDVGSYLAGQGVTALQAVLMDADAPMEIKYSTQLAQITGSALLSGNYKLVDNITLNCTWKGIGASGQGNNFSGIFDGNEKTITYDNSYGSVEYPLFNYASGATIKNLTVSGQLTAAASQVGGIVGYANGAITIEDCHAKALTISASTTSTASVGGLVGYYYDNATTSVSLHIKDCTVSESTSISGAQHVGGILGNYYGYYSVGGSGLIEGCNVTGTIASNNNSYNNAGAGGVVGYATGKTNSAVGALAISGCYVTNATIQGGSRQGYAGGIVGYQEYGDVTNCTVTGCTITTNASRDAYAAGIAGKVRINNSTISNCTVSDTTSSATTTGSNYVAYAAGAVACVSADSGGSTLTITGCTIDGTLTLVAVIPEGATQTETDGTVTITFPAT